MGEQMTSLLNTDNLSVSIAGKNICQELNWQVKPGQHWALMGLNGIGKTTLFNSLAGLFEVDNGSISLLDKPLASYHPRSLAKQLGYLLQSLSYEFPQTVREFCINALYPHINRWESLSEEHLATIQNALKLTDLENFQNRLINTLSGGEKRRMEIAGLLIQKPRIWLLDEPVNHLDLHHQLQMMQTLVNSANKHNGATISIMHDPNLAARYCSHVLMLMGNGQYEIGETERLLNEENLSSLFHHPINAVLLKGKTFFLPN